MKKVAVVFGGYGTQYVGMGKGLYDNYRLIQEFFEEAYSCQNMNFVKLCFAASDVDLAEINASYQSIFLYSSALFAMLKESGLEVCAVTGLDLGYYPAVYAAGSITFPDGLYYLNKLASFYEFFLSEHKILAIEVSGISQEEIDKICKKFFRKTKPVYISIQKDSKTFVISGHQDSVENIHIYIRDKFEDAYVKDASVNVGLYSELMKPVYDQIKLYVDKVDIKDSSVKLISPSGKQISDALDIRSDLIGNILYPFNYLNIFKNLYEYDILIAVSAKGKLAELLKKYYPDKEVITFSDIQDLEAIKSLLGEKYKELEHVS